MGDILKDPGLVKTIDWLVLIFGLVGVFLLIAKGFGHVDYIGNVPLDANAIAVGLVISYTTLNGFKNMLTGNVRLGLNMVLFSLMVLFIGFISMRFGGLQRP